MITGVNPHETLLSQLQSATEGSRELDALVFVEVSIPNCTDEMYVRLPNRYDYEDGARSGDYWLVQRSGKQLKATPHYTTNLQDAVSLVHSTMHGIDYELTINGTADGETFTAASLRWWDKPRADDTRRWKNRSGNKLEPALAVCEALAKVIESSKAEAAA